MEFTFINGSKQDTLISLVNLVFEWGRICTIIQQNPDASSDYPLKCVGRKLNKITAPNLAGKM
jgi:hypothetical protein